MPFTNLNAVDIYYETHGSGIPLLFFSETACARRSGEQTAVGVHGKMIEEDLHRCCLGQHFIADPDGVLLDMSEN
jgi:hypothetical protein